MIQQFQPNPWSCLATSFAMAFDLPVREVIQLLGHDGSTLVPEWKHLREPYNRLGFHIQEFILLGYKMGYAITPFEPLPVSVSLDPSIPKRVLGTELWVTNFEQILATNYGVLTGQTMTKSHHALACNLGTVYDPAGIITHIDDFNIQCFWRVIKSEI